MIAGTLGRYIGLRFLTATMSVFAGIFLLVVLIDYIELTRRTANNPNAAALTVALTSLYRVPQIMERLLPFSVLIGAMTCFLNLSRRNELVIARAAGISAWQFVAPAAVAAVLFGLFAATVYNPLAAHLSDRAKDLETEIFGVRTSTQGGFWLRQRSGDGQSVMHTASSRGQGESLIGISVFLFDHQGTFTTRIQAESATFGDGAWRLTNARIYTTTAPPQEAAVYELKTNLTNEQIRESFATPDTVSFWDLPAYIDLAERAGLVAAGYRLQYQLLLARPFLLASMVLLAACVSLRFFRSGGVTRLVLGGVVAGFLLYVMAKVTEDLSKAQLMHAVTAAWLPAAAGALTGVVTLLFQEDG